MLHGELHIHEALHLQRLSKESRLTLDLFNKLRAEAVRRKRARRVARVNAGLLDMLHDAADPDFVAVTHSVNVHFHRVIQEPIKEHRAVVAHLDRLTHVGLEILPAVDDIHRAAAKHVRRTHNKRVPDFVRHHNGVFLGPGRAVRRLQDAKVSSKLLEAAAVFRDID